jgi:hypothetical protein
MSWRVIVDDILNNPRYVSSRDSFVKNANPDMKLRFRPRCYHVTIYLKRVGNHINEMWDIINSLTKDKWSVFEKNRKFDECKLFTKDNIPNNN